MIDFDLMNTYTSYISIFTITLAFLELGYDIRRKRKRDLKEVAANTSIIIITRIIASATTAAALFTFLEYLSQYKVLSLSLPVSMHILLGFLVADFCYYLSHYYSHKFRVLWGVHGVHHSSHEFNLFTAIRLNWLSPVVDLIFYSWPVLLGIDVGVLSSMRILVLVLQFWIHNDKMKPMPWFDRVFNSPANHMIHHSVEIEHRDKNFGGVFMLWDHLFGTYQKPSPENRPTKFGVTTPVNSYNPLKIYFHEYIIWYKELRRN